MFYLTTHSTHFIYGYMASDIWLRTILIVRKETRCRNIGYSYRLKAMVLLYAPTHRQDSTYHGLCYTNCGALAGTRNSSMGWGRPFTCTGVASKTLGTVRGPKTNVVFGFILVGGLLDPRGPWTLSTRLLRPWSPEAR